MPKPSQRSLGDEYLDLTQSCRKRPRGRRNSSWLIIITSGLIIFMMGLIGGLLLSTKGRMNKRIAGNSPTVGKACTLAIAPQSKENGTPSRAGTVPASIQEPVGKKESPATRRVSNEADASSKTIRHDKSRPSLRAVTMHLSPSSPKYADSWQTHAGNGYAGRMRKLIERHKEQPVARMKTGAEERCMIVCIVRRDGTIKHTEVIVSSGNASLDKAALRSVGNVGRFPPVPGSIPGEDLVFYIPVKFRASGK